MRASNSGSIISDELLVLAAGGCAEHETGIASMRHTLGVACRPSPISEVLRGAASADRWPTTVEDFRVTDGSRVVFLEMLLSIPASVARRVAERKYRRANPPALACKAYIEAMTADGKKRVPSVQLRFGVLALLSSYSMERLGLALEQSPLDVSAPLKVTHKELSLILSAMDGREMYLPCVEDLLGEELLRQGYGPELTEELRENNSHALRPRAAWDSAHFCILGTGDAVAHLRDFAQAFREGRAYCGLHSQKNPFARAGLAFVHECGVTDELRANVQQQWAAERELLKRVRDTGIMAKLEASGKRFYALSPRLDDKGELTFWLNPCEQNRYNYGWMSLQDLQDWADNKGRIVKQVA